MTETAVFDGKTAVKHAEAAAEAIRAINHLTFHDTALSYPSDAWRLINHLASTAYGLTQALRQTGKLVARMHERGQVGIDDGTAYAGDTAAAVRDTLAGLHDARLLAAALHQAGRPLTHAHHSGPLKPSDTEDDGAAVTGEGWT